MEQLIYKYKNTTITKNFEDLNCDEFLKELIDVMQLVWYSRENISKSLENVTIEL